MRRRYTPAVSSLAVLRELPAGFEHVSNARAVLAVRTEWRERLRAAGYGLEADAKLRASDLGGRKALLELTLDGRRLLVRRFSHGGLLRWLTGTRFRDPERPFRELVDVERLRAAGVPAAHVVAARARRAPAFGWHLELVFERIEGALDLARAVREADAPRRAALIEAAGRLVARLHALGFIHADLHPRNLLVEPDPTPRVVVIDLDRSQWRARLEPRARRDNLRRLLRYAERDPGVSPRDCARFLRAYEPDRATRRVDARAIRDEHLRARDWHGWGRRFEAWFGPQK